MIYSEEAKATAAKVELILKVARAAFVDAIDFLACIETLEAGNQPEIIQSLGAAKAGRTAELIQRTLFGHCLMSVMTAFDPLRSGDFHLAVGMALVAQQTPRMALCMMKGTNLADIEAAERHWAECLNFEHLGALRTYRNKSVAHMSEYPADMDQPLVHQLFDLARMTAKVVELLARGTGIAQVSLASQVVPFRENGRAFWDKWKQPDGVKTPLARSEELLTRVKEALTPNRLPLLIVIDGADGCGKSSLASWLAWQLGMPAVQLDLYLTDLTPMRWLTTELARVVKHRIDNGRPVILDGVCALDVVDQIKYKADFLIFLRGGSEQSSLAPQIAAYRSRQRPDELAQFTLEGYVE
jgi:hypothetical protein